MMARVDASTLSASPPLPSASSMPPIVAAAEPHARVRFLEFFAAEIRNPHTRRAYM